MVAPAIQAQQIARDVQAQIGLIAAALSAHSFRGVNVRTGAGAEDWAAEVTQQVLELRDISSRVAVLTYQLARWLQTGYTLGDTGAITGTELVELWISETLNAIGLPSANGVLGEEIRAALRNSTPEALPALADRVATFERELAYARGEVGIDPWNWDFLDKNGSTKIADLLREHALRSAREQLKRVTDLSPEDLDRITAGADSRGAGLADALVMQGGRAIPVNTSLADTRVVYYARGTSSNPCHFCAMLASRGPVYKAGTNITYSALAQEVRSYHDNCHCFPIFSFSDDTELPVQNQFFEQNWGTVTEDYAGREKLNAWRRWLDANKRANGGALKFQ